MDSAKRPRFRILSEWLLGWVNSYKNQTGLFPQTKMVKAEIKSSGYVQPKKSWINYFIRSMKSRIYESEFKNVQKLVKKKSRCVAFYIDRRNVPVELSTLLKTFYDKQNLRWIAARYDGSFINGCAYSRNQSYFSEIKRLGGKIEHQHGRKALISFPIFCKRQGYSWEVGVRPYFNIKGLRRFSRTFEEAQEYDNVKPISPLQYLEPSEEDIEEFWKKFYEAEEKAEKERRRKKVPVIKVRKGLSPEEEKRANENLEADMALQKQKWIEAANKEQKKVESEQRRKKICWLIRRSEILKDYDINTLFWHLMNAKRYLIHKRALEHQKMARIYWRCKRKPEDFLRISHEVEKIRQRIKKFEEGENTKKSEDFANEDNQTEDIGDDGSEVFEERTVSHDVQAAVAIFGEEEVGELKSKKEVVIELMTEDMWMAMQMLESRRNRRAMILPEFDLTYREERFANKCRGKNPPAEVMCGRVVNTAILKPGIEVQGVTLLPVNPSLPKNKKVMTPEEREKWLRNVEYSLQCYRKEMFEEARMEAKEEVRRELVQIYEIKEKREFEPISCSQFYGWNNDKIQVE